MKKIELEDLKDIAEYERIRDDLRRWIIELKKHRRLHLGEFLTLVFENRDTALYQVQEMIRTERIVHPSKVLEEVEVYNELIPAAGELSATMFIEIVDDQKLREWLPRLVNIEQRIRLEFPDGTAAAGRHEEGRSTEEKTSTVHYLKFPLSPPQLSIFLSPEQPVRARVHHTHYSAEAAIEGEIRQSLIQDLLVD